MAEYATMQLQSIVSLTENAAAHLRQLLAQDPDSEGKFLRLYAEGGGSSGMQYGMVFDEKRKDDLLAELHGLTILVDPFSADYIHGARIDYIDALDGGGFRITNPSDLPPRREAFEA